MNASKLQTASMEGQKIHCMMGCDTCYWNHWWMKMTTERKDVILHRLFSKRLGRNQKEQFLLWPGCLGRRVAAWRFDAISMKTFVMTVAALQYRLVNCCLLNTEFLDGVKLFCQLLCLSLHATCMSPDDTVHMLNKIFINDINVWRKQVENFSVATAILPKKNVTQPD